MNDDISPQNEEKQYGRQIHSFSCEISPLLPTLNIYFDKQTVKLKKDFTKVSKVDVLFDFNLQYRSIYATFKLLAQFSFASVLKMLSLS